MPVSAYALGRDPINALVLGFATSRPEALSGGVECLVAAIVAASRRETGPQVRTPASRAASR